MSATQIVFSPIKGRRIFEGVSANIKELILNGTLKSGDRLPSEIELAQQFNVSRQTVREALRILELSGFITVQTGGNGGPLIKNTILNSISNLFIDAFRLQNISVEELTGARLEIEKIVLAHAIKNADQEDYEALRKNLLMTRRGIEQGREVIDENIQFHMLLAKASKNNMFVLVVGSIAAVVKDLLSRISPHGKPQMHVALKSANTLDYHTKILEAMEAGNSEEAMNLLSSHLLEVQNRIGKVVASDQE